MLHSGSCCPTMDVAVLSSPPISASDAEVHLYRLGGSSTSFGGQEADEQDDYDDGDGDGDDVDDPQPSSSSSSSRVWQVIVPSKKADVQAPPAQQQQDRKGKGRASKAAAPLEEAYIQPRPPESVAWSPDGERETAQSIFKADVSPQASSSLSLRQQRTHAFFQCTMANHPYPISRSQETTHRLLPRTRHNSSIFSAGRTALPPTRDRN